MPWTTVPPMLLRLVARPSDAEPELPFCRDAPFRDAPFGRDAPFRAALARDGVVCFGDVVRLADVERLADGVRRFWVVPPLRAVDRFVVFVAGSEPEVVVFRRVAELDFLVVAIGSPILKLCSTCLARLPRHRPFLTGGQRPR